MKSILLILSILVSTPINSAIFQVNRFDIDVVDEIPGDGQCKIAADNVCTLRAAVMEANALPGNETINLSLMGAGENLAATGDLDITESVTIGTFV